MTENNLALVKRIAHRLIRSLPASVEVDDLIQAGMIGLMEAERNYNVTQGAHFETYAAIRIRGAMVDEIRKGDWAPRSLRRRIRAIKTARASVLAHHDHARDAEVAAAAGMTLDAYHTTRREEVCRIFSMEGSQEVLSQETDSPGPPAILERERVSRALFAEIDGLPERERAVMSLYFREDLNWRETGEVLGLSESRTCQIYAKALARLKIRLRDWA